MTQNTPQPAPPRPHGLQQSLFPPAPPAPPPPAPGSDPSLRWLQRLSLFIFVIFCIQLGVIVAILPWPFFLNVWDHNMFLTSHPRLWSILRLGPVRGLISGLGLLDIWIGLSEAVNYRDTPRNSS